MIQYKSVALTICLLIFINSMIFTNRKKKSFQIVNADDIVIIFTYSLNGLF